MPIQPALAEQLLLEIERLRQELADVKRDKADLEILLETTTAHADIVEIQLYESNQRLQAEIVERQRAEAALQRVAAELRFLLDIVNKDKTDLEILLQTTTEHGDAIEDLLYDKAEEVVRDSERKLAQFLEAVPIGISIIDASGKPYYLNQVAKQLLGRGAKPASVEQFPDVYQLYITGTNQLYPVDRMPGVRSLLGESTTVDNMEIHQGDKIVPIEAWGTPIFDKQGNIVYAITVFQDITQRKQAEAERINFTNNLFQLNQSFSRFVPRQFLQLLGKESIIDVKLGDQVQQEMSVLFADIRDFTMLSESMTPEDNFKFINDYLSRMEPAIIENHGFIDKYVGDEIMALFSGGADNAVQAAIAMLHRLTEYNLERTQSSQVAISIGIGINTGSLMLGTVGGHSRMDSTVISDTVNLTSRIEGLTKEYGVPLLISHQTFSQLEDANQYLFRLVEQVKVKGKSAPVSVYEVFDADSPRIRDAKLATKTAFEKALLLYNMHAFEEAAQLLQDCLHLNPQDTVAQIYLERCQRFNNTLRNNPKY